MEAENSLQSVPVPQVPAGPQDGVDQRARDALQGRGSCVDKGGGGQAVGCLVFPVLCRRAEQSWPMARGAASVPGLTSSFLLLAGEQTKALVTQLTLFNRLLTELREDIRDQVRQCGGTSPP